VKRPQLQPQCHDQYQDSVKRLQLQPQCCDQGKVELHLRKTRHAKFGFTIVGGVADLPLIQIKHIVPGSVASKEGSLKVGDVLVKIDGLSVVTYTHWEVVKIIQNLDADQDHIFEIARGFTLNYALPLGVAG